MSEILSQQEIDELLKALSEGELDVIHTDETKEKKIKRYDFLRPNKFAKDQLRTMQIIHDHFSRLMASYISGTLRTFCQVEVVSVEPQTYHEFTNSLPEPVILSIIDFKPLKGSIIMELSPDISYIFIDRLLGGYGGVFEKSRSFTEIEIVLLERIIRQLLVLMNESWLNVLKTDFKLQRIETNAQFVQILSPNETIAIITIKVRVGDLEGMINLCIPYMVIEPVIKQLSTKFWFSSKLIESSEGKSALLSKHLETTSLDMRVILGGTSLPVRDFLDLQKGDVIPLDNKVDDPVSIMVGSTNKYTGLVGTRNKKLAVQIIDIDKGDYLNE